MTDEHPGSACPDPRRCLWAGPHVVGENQLCRLCGAWCNCLAAGCLVSLDGKTIKPDNSPGACERRLRAIAKEERCKSRRGETG